MVFFPVRVMALWNRFPEEVDASFLEVFKAKVNEVLGNLV